MVGTELTATLTPAGPTASGSLPLMECALSKAFSLSHRLFLEVALASVLLFVFVAQTVSCLSRWGGEGQTSKGGHCLINN